MHGSSFDPDSERADAIKGKPQESNIGLCLESLTSVAASTKPKKEFVRFRKFCRSILRNRVNSPLIVRHITVRDKCILRPFT